MLKKISLVLAVVWFAFLGYVALKPSQYTVSRALLIQASPAAIFPHINNHKRTNEWMPWAETDPSVQMKYSSPAEGVGSSVTWESTGQMGVGKAETIESVKNEKVISRLTYTKPMEMTQDAEISLSPAPGGGTLVRWSVTGHNNFLGRLVCTFMNMDKMIGAEFEKGLARLKTRVETKK